MRIKKKVKKKMMGFSTTDNDRRVTILRDSKTSYPELWMEVFIGSGPPSETRAFPEFFAKARCTKADSPSEADLVVFVGGADVNPSLYGAEEHDKTFYDSAQDQRDMDLYFECLAKGIPMLGICRGAQFLHVMNGGKLYQDVDNHVGDHPMYDTRGKRIIHNVSSVHHQMCIENRSGGMEVLADSSVATERWLDNTTRVIGHRMDVEAYFYRDTCCIGIQGHPEYKGYSQFAQWTFERLNELILENPDIELIDRYRRMKPHLIAEREARWDEKKKELN